MLEQSSLLFQGRKHNPVFDSINFTTVSIKKKLLGMTKQKNALLTSIKINQ
jgi:hypothetical protein